MRTSSATATRWKANEVWAYAAGILDGEGCISMQRLLPRDGWKSRQKSVRYEYNVCVINTAEPMVRWLHEEFGGSFNNKAPGKVGWQPQFRWLASGFNAESFLRGVLPYLRVKHEQAALMIEYIERKGYGRLGRGRVLAESEIAYRESVYQRMCALNQRGRQQRLSGVASRPDEATV